MKEEKVYKKSSATKILAVILILALLSGGGAVFFLLKSNHELQSSLNSAKTEISVADAQIDSLEDELKVYREGSIYTQEEMERLVSSAQKEKAEETRKDILAQMKEKMLSGNGTVPMLRSFFPEDIVFLQGGNYYFIPIDEAVTPRQWKNDNLVCSNESQWYDYQENGVSVVRKGIDVSSFQGNINWAKVKAAGIDFAIIRLGIRGYGSGKLVTDSQFENNIKGALANGVDVAVYFFSEAITDEEAVEEAEYVIEALRPYNIKCTVAIDIENVNDSSARTANQTKEAWTSHTIAFLERIKEEGYTPMIYGNMESFMLMLDISKLNDYHKWWAAYYDYFYYPYDFTVWQFSEKGKVDGIAEKVDLNISFGGWVSQIIEENADTSENGN